MIPAEVDEFTDIPPAVTGDTSSRISHTDEAHAALCADFETRVDGRVLRGRRNRQALIDAFFDLAAERLETPRASDVAARAGLSVRSLFQHFSDLDELRATVVNYKVEQAYEHLLVEREAIDPSLDLDTRLDAILQSRALLWEMLAPLRHVHLLRDGGDAQVLAQGTLAKTTKAVRGQLQMCFAKELDALPLDPDIALSSLQMSLSSSSWDHLRLVHGYDIDTAIGVMKVTALAVLNQCGSPRHVHANNTSNNGS